MKDFITIGGTRYRVECNWNAYVEFLKAIGKDEMSELVTLGNMRPSDTAAMMAAAINEGERLEGHEVHLDAQSVGAEASIFTISEFLTIYQRQTEAKLSESAPEEKSPKNE